MESAENMSPEQVARLKRARREEMLKNIELEE